MMTWRKTMERVKSCDICGISSIEDTMRDPHAPLIPIESLFGLWMCAECLQQKVTWLAIKRKTKLRPWWIIPIYDESLTYYDLLPYVAHLKHCHITELPPSTPAAIPAWHFATKEVFFQNLAYHCQQGKKQNDMA